MFDEKVSPQKKPIGEVLFLTEYSYLPQRKFTFYPKEILFSLPHLCYTE